MIEASIICDSISPQGKRLTTFRLRYPKFIHGEMMTHRVISRNASSSRAVPTKKLLEEVRSDALRATFVSWGANQKGMQAGTEHHAVVNLPYDVDDIEFPTVVDGPGAWRQAALHAANIAEAMDKAGYHKQIVNRLLEPFSHINVVATATEWSNFFGLRLHHDAQPEMRALAIAMWGSYNASEPRLCQPGVNWHLPFFQPEDWDHLMGAQKTNEEVDRYMTAPGEILGSGSYAKDLAIKVSVARCARVSYESFETGKRSTVEEDLKLYDRLLGEQPLHASPAEHQATPDGEAHFMTFPRQGETLVSNRSDEWGNFKGWIQYRQLLPNEAVAPIPEEFR